MVVMADPRLLTRLQVGEEEELGTRFLQDHGMQALLILLHHLLGVAVIPEVGKAMKFKRKALISQVGEDPTKLLLQVGEATTKLLMTAGEAATMPEAHGVSSSKEFMPKHQQYRTTTSSPIKPTVAASILKLTTTSLSKPVEKTSLLP